MNFSSDHRKRREMVLGWMKEPLGFFRFALGSLVTKESLLVFGTLLVLWEVLPQTGVLPKSLVPAFSDCGMALVRLCASGQLVKHVLSSISTLLAGLLFAGFLGVGLGVLTGWQVRIRRYVLPLVQVLSPIPPTAWIPMAMIFLGVGNPMRIFLVALGAFFPVFLNTFQAVKDIDQRYVQSARVFGASEWNILFHVHLPQALSPILMSLRTGFGLGLIMMTVAEMYGSNTGVGFLLVQSKTFFRIPEMVVCMVLLGLTGWFFSELLRYLEYRICRWKVQQ